MMKILIKWLKFVLNLKTEKDLTKSKRNFGIQDVSIWIKVCFYWNRLRCRPLGLEIRRVSAVIETSTEIIKLLWESFDSIRNSLDLKLLLHKIKWISLEKKVPYFIPQEERKWLFKCAITLSHVMIRKRKPIGISWTVWTP